MLFYNLFRALVPAKHQSHRDNRPIQHLVQIIHSHTIDSLQKPTETLSQFIDNYLSLMNIDKRRNASKRLREIVEQTSTDKNELSILDCLEAFRQSVENFIRAYSSRNVTLVSKEYEKFQTHFWLLFCRLRYCFLLPTWKCLNIDALNSFELFGGFYLLLDILLLDYYLHIKRPRSDLFNCKQEVGLPVRKFTFYFLFDAFYTRWQYESKCGLSIQELFSRNRRLMTIFLEMLNTQPVDRYTYLYINQRIIWLYQHLYEPKPGDKSIPGTKHLPALFYMNMRQTNGVTVLKNFCNTIQDKELFIQTLGVLIELTSTIDCPELYQNFNNSMIFLLNSVKVPFDLRPENNRFRIWFWRFCERILPRRMFCKIRDAYENTTYEVLWFVIRKTVSHIMHPIMFHMNSDSGWRNCIGRMIFSTLDYIFFAGTRSWARLLNASYLLDNILFDISDHPVILERLRQEDICSILVDILSTERKDLVETSCRSMTRLIDIEQRGEEAEPERQRLRELGVVDKLKYFMKYSAEGEEIHDLAEEILDNLAD